MLGVFIGAKLAQGRLRRSCPPSLLPVNGPAESSTWRRAVAAG